MSLSRSDPTLRAAPSSRAQGIGFVVASAIAFGAMAILARVAFASGVDIPTLLALRFAIAAACLCMLVAMRNIALPRGRNLGAAVLLGGVGYGGQAATFFIALTLAPAGLVALLLYLHPALVAILAWLFLREPVTRAKLVALLIALTGMFLTVAPALNAQAGSAWPALPLGIAFGLAAAAIYAVYIVIGMRLTTRMHPLALSTVVVSSAAAVFVAAAAMEGPRFPGTVQGWAAVIGIALVSTVAAITLFFAGLARIGPTQAATLSSIEPVVTVLLAASLLGERIGIVQLLGGGLIVGAVLLLARAPAPAVSDGLRTRSGPD